MVCTHIVLPGSLRLRIDSELESASMSAASISTARWRGESHHYPSTPARPTRDAHASAYLISAGRGVSSPACASCEVLGCSVLALRYYCSSDGVPVCGGGAAYVGQLAGGDQG